MKKIVLQSIGSSKNSSYIGEKNDVIVENKIIYVHDGMTPGGIAIANTNSISPNAISNSISINLSGDIFGNSSGNILNVSTFLVNSTIPGTYNNITINSKGFVVSGNNSNYQISNVVSINFSGSVTGNAVGNTLNAAIYISNVITPGTYNNIVVGSNGLISNGTNNSLIYNTVYMTSASISANASTTSSANSLVIMSTTLPTSGVYSITYSVRCSAGNNYGIETALYQDGNGIVGTLVTGNLIPNSEIFVGGAITSRNIQYTATGNIIFSAANSSTIISVGIWGGQSGGVYGAAESDNNGRSSLTYVKIG